MASLPLSHIFTHRGIEPSHPNFYSESTYEAFKNHLSRGFGIEFDVNFTKDGIVIAHDANLTRLTQGKDSRVFRNLTTQEVVNVKLPNGRFCTFDELMQEIQKSSSNISTLHLKGRYQKQTDLDRLIKQLQKYSDLYDRILIFDVKPETARYLISKNPAFHLAPSVAHPYDIERYNSSIGNTLISLEDAIRYKQEGLYDWVWLDEWDLTDANGKTKTLYNTDTFDILRQASYKISLVTPELHGTSPGLYGGESHPDAKNKEILFKRIEEIIKLQPDAICTDYPEEVAKL